MTSLYYGLPKIINNEDDDNDLPADCDFDDITLNQLPLPLPGESTKMSPFLCYIKLAKILSSILKELYTTTRRRNGVQKIEQLTRELQVWESLSEITIGKLTDLEQDYGQHRDGSGEDILSIWLHLLSQMALIYVHRPALTFETTEPQFKASLALCSKASVNVISMLHRFRREEQLFRIFPAGPNLIFQSALLCLYRTWHQIPSASGTSPESSIHDNENIELNPVIEIASSLLDDLNHTGFSQHLSLQDDFSTKPPPLLQASWVLRHLSTITTQHLQTSTIESPRSTISANALPNYTISVPSGSRSRGLETTHFSPDSVRPSLSEQYMHGSSGSPISSDFLFGDGNGLGYLNQMDESTWTFLSQMGGYSGEANASFTNYG
jgi:hypothetical protein